MIDPTPEQIARGACALTGNDPDAPAWTVFTELAAAEIAANHKGEKK